VCTDAGQDALPQRSRWATYERVCQLTRRGRLFPGNQGAHYWQDPEEAFAQSYARLNRPDDRVSWQYTPLLRPTPAALAKIHADVAHPWSGPVEATWDGSVTAPPRIRLPRLACAPARSASAPAERSAPKGGSPRTSSALHSMARSRSRCGRLPARGSSPSCTIRPAGGRSRAPRPTPGGVA
jgi:hypothetical protein